MRRPRVTVRKLLGTVVVLALACASLREATGVRDRIVFNVTLLVLVSAILLTVHRRGERRAYWLGFALFGWAYLLASLVHPVEARLLTTSALYSIDAMLWERPWYHDSIKAIDPIQASWAKPAGKRVSGFTSGGEIVPQDGLGVLVWDEGTGRTFSRRKSPPEDFVRVGHSLLALLAAFFGGALSRWLHARGMPEDAGPAVAA